MSNPDIPAEGGRYVIEGSGRRRRLTRVEGDEATRYGEPAPATADAADDTTTEETAE